MEFDLLKIKGVYYLNGEKLKRVRCNSSREIWVGEKYVLKVDCYGRGSTGSSDIDQQCKNEWEKWKEIEKEDKKFFAETLGFGKLRKNRYWIVQEKETFMSLSKTRKEIKEFEKILVKYNLDNDVFISKESSDHWINCTINQNNQIICYDYGYPKQNYI